MGGEYTITPLQEITMEQLRYNMNVGFESNFCKHSILFHALGVI